MITDNSFDVRPQCDSWLYPQLSFYLACFMFYFPSVLLSHSSLINFTLLYLHFSFPLSFPNITFQVTFKFTFIIASLYIISCCILQAFIYHSITLFRSGHCRQHCLIQQLRCVMTISMLQEKKNQDSLQYLPCIPLQTIYLFVPVVLYQYLASLYLPSLSVLYLFVLIYLSIIHSVSLYIAFLYALTLSNISPESVSYIPLYLDSLYCLSYNIRILRIHRPYMFYTYQIVLHKIKHSLL